jgi:hypothetical protein
VAERQRVGVGRDGGVPEIVIVQLHVVVVVAITLAVLIATLGHVVNVVVQAAPAL